MSEFIQGFQTTEGEKKYDYNALGNLPDLSISKDDITGALGFVPPSKAEVEASVKVASNAAATADNKAVAAQTTANQAVGAAQQAQSAAEDAMLVAQNAQNRADDAHERIDDSQTQIVQGSIITIDDCDNAPLQNLRIFGKTTQNGIPTPDAPIALDSAGDSGSLTVKVCGKNLFNPSNCEEGIYADGSNVVHENEDMCSFVLRLDPNFTYTLKQALNSNFMRYAFAKEYPAKGVKTSQMTPYSPYAVVTLKSPSTEYIYAIISFYRTTTSSYSLEEVKNSIQIEIGNTATEYEPYKDGGTLNIQKPEEVPVFLPGIPVTSGGNYTDENGQQWICDEVDFEKGVYVQRIGTSEGKSWSKSNIATGLSGERYVIVDENRKTERYCKVLCTSYPQLNYASHSTEGDFISTDEVNKINIRCTEKVFGSADAFNEWVTNTGMVVLYPLTNPIEHDLSPEELTQYAVLHTNYPNTTVYNDAGAGMELKYATPTTALPLTGGRYRVATPYAPTDAVPKSYADRIDKKVDTLREVVSSFHSNIVQEASGEVIQVYGSAEAPLVGLKVFGKTEQRTTTGKNLLKIIGIGRNELQIGDDSLSYQADGLTGTLKADGTIEISGTVTSTANSYCYFRAQNLALSAGTYSFSGFNGLVFTDGTVFRSTFTLSEQKTFDYGFLEFGTSTATNQVYNLQIERGSTATAYEPYTGGAPSPSPDYPQALESVGDGGTVKVRVCGKNLFSPKKFPVTTSKNGITFVNNGDGSFDISGTASADTILTLSWSTDGSSLADIIRLGGSFVFSCDQAVYENKTFNCSIVYKYAGGNRYILASGLPTEVPAGAEYASMSIWISSGTTVKTVTNGHLQLEYGTVATAYEPYKDVQTLQVATANGLPGIPVAQGGNYTDGSGQQWICDEVDFAKGVYVQRIGTKQLDGSESWGYTGAYFSTFHDALGSNSSYLGLCSHFNDDSFFVGPGGFGFYHTSQSVEDWRAWLAENNPTLIFVLAKYIETPLTVEELAQYAALRTNYPNTTVLNDAGAHMDLKYVADTKKYVDNKFAELAEILINKL